MKSGNINFLEPSGPLQASNGTAFTAQIYYKIWKKCPDLFAGLQEPCDWQQFFMSVLKPTNFSHNDGK